MLGRLKISVRKMKDKWRNYALKDGKVKESYIREYISRSPKRKVKGTKCCHCHEQSEEKLIQKEVKKVKDVKKKPTKPKIKKVKAVKKQAYNAKVKTRAKKK